MIPSIKGCDLFSNRPVSLRSRRAHVNPEWRFGPASQSSQPAGLQASDSAEPSAGQTGFSRN